MHDLGRPHDLSAEDLADALVAETDPEHGEPFASELGDRGRAHAGVLGPAWARRHEQGGGFERPDAGDVDGIVADHDRLGAELAEVLDEVVDEAVVVVDDGHPHAHAGEVTGRANHGYPR